MADLEETVKEKVGPLLEETMEKHWGITIPKLEDDITDQLKKPHLQLYVPPNSTFRQAKKLFKAKFLENELKLHRGNVSHLAKALGIDRRSIHRAIKDLDIDMEGVRDQHDPPQEAFIDQTIRSSLEQYREIIQPDKLASVYEEIPRLSRNIAKFLPHNELTLKEAEREFEEQFLTHALQGHQGNITATAKSLRIRAETLYRKVKKLHIVLGKTI
jgi:transcriptional regulator with PAS, ATPase and Fis domain